MAVVVTREPVEEKARRYLAEGRLTVGHVDAAGVVLAVCRGESGEYALAHTLDDGWTCDCPARRDCAHLAALRLVTRPPERDADVWAAIDAAVADIPDQEADPFAGILDVHGVPIPAFPDEPAGDAGEGESS